MKELHLPSIPATLLNACSIILLVNLLHRMVIILVHDDKRKAGTVRTGCSTGNEYKINLFY